MSLRALAFDVATGREVVNVEVFRDAVTAARSIPRTRARRPSPIVEGDRVYVHFGAEGTAALTTAGEIVWKTRFSYESQHGAGGSPILYGDLLIVSCDGGDAAFVVAIDKRTGKTRWKTSRRQPWDQAYTTPLVIRVGDRDQIVSVGAFRAAAYDPESGKEIWRVSYGDGFSNVPRPVYGHGLVFIATGFQQPTLIAVRPDGTGDVSKTHVAWTLAARCTADALAPHRRGRALPRERCLASRRAWTQRTGAIHWQQRLNGTFSASPVFADGRIYFLSEDGVATVIAPGLEFRILATNRLDGATLASMAVAGGSIYIRSATHLYRIGKS